MFDIIDKRTNDFYNIHLFSDLVITAKSGLAPRHHRFSHKPVIIHNLLLWQSSAIKDPKIQKLRKTDDKSVIIVSPSFPLVDFRYSPCDSITQPQPRPASIPNTSLVSTSYFFHLSINNYHGSWNDDGTTGGIS